MLNDLGHTPDVILDRTKLEELREKLKTVPIEETAVRLQIGAPTLRDILDALAREYGEYFASSAYSEFRPVDQGKTEAAFQQNRRIEISVVLKDAGIRSVIDEYMRNQVPIGGE